LQFSSKHPARAPLTQALGTHFQGNLKMQSRSNFTAYLLIALGIYFLLSKLDLIPNIIPMLFDWWPVILIVIGVSMLVRRASRDGS
jgi:hypothetical protein